ncbi:thioredoxin-like isoform X1 [Ambystoma mexicanum]|uniref:thioredoxin-like isoform X1 n=1 Tax=Ambystoma mexicanum TaxID=8296 RepID=UPI0037E91507
MALEIQSKGDLYSVLESAGSRLVVVQFYAKWCGSCKAIFPAFMDIIHRYRNVLFARVDIDEVQELTHYFHIKSTPTFQFYQNEEKLDEFSGSKAEALENRIRELM